METSAAGEALREIGPLWETSTFRRRSSVRDRMLSRQSAAARALEAERHLRWTQHGATEAFMEHVLPHLPSTRAQRAVLVGLVDPTGDAGLECSRVWERAASDLPQGKVLKWIADLRVLYISEPDLTSGPLLGSVLADIRFELNASLAVAGTPAPQLRPSYCLMNAALTLAHLEKTSGLHTERDFEVALDRDRAETPFERDDGGSGARKLLMRVGEWGADCVADGTLGDLTHADLGFDYQAADSYGRSQMDVVRTEASRFPIATATGSASYLHQAGLNGRLSDELAAAIDDRPSPVAVALAWGVKTAMESSYGTVTPTPEQSAQIAMWLRSTEQTSTKPVENFFMAPYLHSTALRMAFRANLSRFGPSVGNGATRRNPGSGAAPTARGSSIRRKMRPLRNFPSGVPRSAPTDA